MVVGLQMLPDIPSTIRTPSETVTLCVTLLGQSLYHMSLVAIVTRSFVAPKHVTEMSTLQHFMSARIIEYPKIMHNIEFNIEFLKKYWVFSITEFFNTEFYHKN